MDAVTKDLIIIGHGFILHQYMPQRVMQIIKQAKKTVQVL